jgi:hypothetical protein
MIWPRKSSKYGTVHPPYLKPFVGSSSGPPGAYMSPSRVIRVRTLIFFMVFLLNRDFEPKAP